MISLCSRRALLAAFFAVQVHSHTTATAAIEPEEVAVIAAKGDRDSLGLARYYCQRRGIPEGHICEVELPEGEVMERKLWEEKVRPEIRGWIEANDPDKKLRCLVTTWGVPLKIGPADQSERATRYGEFLMAERVRRLRKLNEIVAALQRLAGGSLSEAAAPESEARGELPWESTKSRLEQELKAAQTRLRTLPAEERPAVARQVQQLSLIAGGTQVLIQGLGQQLEAAKASGAPAPPALKERFDLLRGRTSAFLQTKFQLEQEPPSIRRDLLALPMLQQMGGMIATIEWLDRQIAGVRKNETGSAFDSELSLVMWPGDYELLRWQPNYLRPEYAESAVCRVFRTLIVGRLDGPTLRIAKGLVDTAIQVEEQGGLRGKVYLDARGIAKRDAAPYARGSYPDYDRSLMQAAEALRGLTSPEGGARFDVTLDEQPALFQPGQCPDAALYCGWYSLAKYVDAFDWKPGSVAYHLASAEAATLKEIDSRAWCKKLLEDGVCVTIGPVYEPYLVAFPRPDTFLARLVQGDLTVGEVYYRTKPFGSWMMTLIGDPMYMPCGASVPATKE